MDGKDRDTRDVGQKYVIIIWSQRRFKNRFEGRVYEVSSACIRVRMDGLAL